MKTVDDEPLQRCSGCGDEIEPPKHEIMCNSCGEIFCDDDDCFGKNNCAGCGEEDDEES